jgi:hypothetical protein
LGLSPAHTAETLDNGGLAVNVSLILELNFRLRVDIRSVIGNIWTDSSKLLDRNLWPAEYLS